MPIIFLENCSANLHRSGLPKKRGHHDSAPLTKKIGQQWKKNKNGDLCAEPWKQIFALPPN